MEELNVNTGKSIRSVIRMIDLRLMPLVFIQEFSSYINRVTMAYARTSGLKTDLHLSKTEDKLAVSLLYVAYLLFAIPSVLLLRQMRAPMYLSMLMIAWGSISIGSAFVTNGVQLIFVRFLLGMTIAGFFPGMIFYLSQWYHRNERTLRIVIFYMAAVLAGAMGGIVGYAIDKMDGLAGLNGWQWIFLLLGIPLILLGVITFVFLNNLPGNISWLHGIPKDIYVNYIRDATDIDPNESTENKGMEWRHMASVFLDYKIWLFTLISVANSVVIKYLVIEFPNLIKAIGYSDAEGQLMVIPPYILACICGILGAIIATKRKEHGYCVMFFLILSSIGFVLMAALAQVGQAAMYVSAYVACSGAYPAFALLMAWLASSVPGHMNKALAISLAVGLGQIGGIIFPFIHQNDNVDEFRRSHIICAVAMGVAAILTFLLRFFYKRLHDDPHREEIVDADR